jgi:AraC-like DNA-binding protein
VSGTKLARSRYDEHRPAPATAAHLACVWVGETGEDGGYTDRILPDACIDVVWDGTELFVAGPDTGPVPMRRDPGTFVVGARFRPGHAPSFLGAPAGAIVDQRVPLDALFGTPAVRRLGDDLAAQPSLLAAARRLEAQLHERVTRAQPPDDRAVDAVVRLAATHDVSTLADDLGVTSRTLHRRCVARFGYGAKTLQQVLRFRGFLADAEERPGANLATLAASAGYADHSHLVRDCRRLSGLAPGKLLVNRRVRPDPAVPAG